MKRIKIDTEKNLIEPETTQHFHYRNSSPGGIAWVNIVHFKSTMIFISHDLQIIKEDCCLRLIVLIRGSIGRVRAGAFGSAPHLFSNCSSHQIRLICECE